MSGKESDERILGRLEEARRWFKDHHAGIGPDPDFAARVAARLERGRAGDLGLAALRLLPATLALALFLLWLAAGTGEATSGATTTSAGDDVMEWVYGEPETTP